MKQKINPNMMDVARHAGVSIATVSNVINRPEKVTAATSERVRASIEELRFVRNDAARSLATGSSKSIGLVLADIDNSIFVDIALGAEKEVDAAGYRLVIGHAACDIRRQDDYLALFDEMRVAGLLLAPMEDSSEGIARMRAHGRQIVLLNFAPPGDDCCAVLEDNEQAGYLAARHLIDTGRTRLAYVAARDSYQPVHDRRLGVRRAATESRVKLEEIEATGLRQADGYDAAREIVARPRRSRPDGIVAVTDQIGNGIIGGLLAGGVDVPGQVGVVGCEDNRSASGGPVALTTVRPPGVAMGEIAMSLLMEELNADPATHAHRVVVLQPELVTRSSS